MPKVKKKPAKKPAARKSPQKKQPKNFVALDTLREFIERFSNAALAGGAIAALAAIGLFWSGGYFGLMNEKISRLAASGAVAAGFGVDRITVMGVDSLSDQELLGAIGPVIGESIFHVDPYAARARVEDMGWVRSAAVARMLPNVLHVSVREREPAAVWQLSGVLHLIDEEGVVIQRVGANEYSHLPLIVGAGAPQAASAILRPLRNEPELWGRASALIRVADRRWNLRTKRGVDVKFPEDEPESAIRYLALVQERFALLDEPIEYIDLRNPESFVYRRKGAGENTQIDSDESR